MAKINSKIDKALRKEVIENGVFLGTVLIYGFNDNIYLYENEVYVEQFKLTDDDYVVTDFYRGDWEVINTNIYNGKFNKNEPYAKELIIFMRLYEESLYLGNKKYREIAKQQFAELKKDYQESGLLDDINALLKKSKSKTFRYSKYESENSARKSIEESMNLDYSDFDVSLYDMMCSQDFFQKVSKEILKKEKGEFDFGESNKDYYWFITNTNDESLEFDMLYRNKSILMHVEKNGKSGKTMKFPLSDDFETDYEQLLDYIFRFLMGTFADNWFESKKFARKSLKESNLPNKVYDVLNELASNFLLDYDEFVEFERNGLEHHFDKIRELGAKLKKADMKGDDDLYQKIADEIVTVVKRANGTLDESKKSVGKSLKEAQYNSKLNRGKGYDVLSWILLDIAEWGEKVIHKDCTIEDGHGGIIFRGKLYEYYIRTRYTDNLTSFDVKYDAWEDLCNDYMVSGFHDKGTPIEIQQLLHKKELWELVEVADWFIGEQNIIELKPTRELVNWAERNYNYV